MTSLSCRTCFGISLNSDIFDLYEFVSTFRFPRGVENKEGVYKNDAKKNIEMVFFTGILILLSSFLTTRGFSITEDEKNNIAVYEKVADGVANITNIAVQKDFFFNASPTQGSGCGSILDSEGHTFTNHHVVANAQKLEVALADGSRWPAKLMGSDPDNDLAVTKIEAPREK